MRSIVGGDEYTALTTDETILLLQMHNKRIHDSVITFKLSH